MNLRMNVNIVGVLCFVLSVANCQSDPNKVWLFAVDGIKRPYNFINDVGELTGFDVDVVNAVCAVAGKKCSFVLAEFQECVFTHRELSYPGRGLMAGWFDACPAYAITVDRLNTFDFTTPYLTTVSTFTVAPGNPENFDPNATDYSNFVLSHLTGAPTNGQCLNRLKKKYKEIIVADDLPEAKALLLNNTVQALFSPRTNISGLEVLPETFQCDEGGAGVMVKKGSELPSWWDPAFRAFYSDGAYSQLCQQAISKYNYNIKCLPPPVRRSWVDLKSSNLVQTFEAQKPSKLSDLLRHN